MSLMRRASFDPPEHHPSDFLEGSSSSFNMSSSRARVRADPPESGSSGINSSSGHIRLTTTSSDFSRNQDPLALHGSSNSNHAKSLVEQDNDENKQAKLKNNNNKYSWKKRMLLALLSMIAMVFLFVWIQTRMQLLKETLLNSVMDKEQGSNAFIEHDSPTLDKGDIAMIKAHYDMDKKRMIASSANTVPESTSSSISISIHNPLHLACPHLPAHATEEMIADFKLNELYNPQGNPWMTDNNAGDESAQLDLATMMTQIFKSLPEHVSFKKNDLIFESAIGAGRFASALFGFANFYQNVQQLQYYGCDIREEGSLNVVWKLIPNGYFCPANAQELTSWVPPNAFDWSISSYIEPLPYSKGGNVPTNQQRWYRWWVFQMARITKPNGWIVIGFTRYPSTYSKSCGGTGCGVEPFFFRELTQSKLWQVDPLSVKVVKVNDDWPKRDILKGRYHVIMQRNSAVFSPTSPCEHVQSISLRIGSSTDPEAIDYQNCKFTEQ